MIRIFFLFLNCLFLAGCSNDTQNSYTLLNSSSPQVFRMNFHSEPASLDPRLVRDIPTATTGKLFFDGLTRLDEQGRPILSLAEKIDISKDRKVYTFILRSAHWSNGLPVTAYDFEHSWKQVLSPDYPAEYAHQLFVIKNGEAAKKGEMALDCIGVKALNAKKLMVELEYPQPYFLELTSFPICYPVCSQLDRENDAWSSLQGEEFICNGPFQLEHWNHGNELKVKKNLTYWDADTVKLNSIEITMIQDEHTELNMYENGELDWAGSPNSSIPPEALPSLKKTTIGISDLFISPIAGTYCYKFNTQAPPFDSINMRKAFALAINRQSLVDDILQANQVVAKALLPPCICDEDRTIDFFRTNRENAVKLFEEALEEKGWTRETLPQITLIFSKSEKHQKVAQAIQQEWNQTFNIKVNLQSYEWNTFIQKLSRHDYQVGGRGWISDLSDPKALLEIYKYTNDPESGGNNDTQWENREFIQLIDLATQCPDEQERKKILLEAEKILIDEMPIIPLYHSTACYLKKPYVKGVLLSNRCDLDFKHAYIER